MPASRRRSSLIVPVLALLTSASAGAQLPDTPVLQNAFVNGGFTAAVNGAGGSGASTYAAAGAWGGGRVQLSVGLGTHSANAVSRFAYGVRAAMPLMGGDRALGVAAFVGVGGTSGARASDSVRNVQLVPIGATIAFRTASALHGISVYASPIYEHYGGGIAGGRGGDLFRAALGVDVGLTSMIGITAGAEFGASAPSRSGGPAGTLLGIGLSYALHRP